MVAKTETIAIELKPLNLQTLKLRLVGDTELITHAWGEKAKKEIEVAA